MEYSKTFKNRQGVELEMRVKAVCAASEDMHGVLGFIAQSSHDFYLGTAREWMDAVPGEENITYELSDEDAKEIEKELWIDGIGAEVFPKPAGYTYTFPGYQGAFCMSKEYADKTPLDELKKAYEQNKQYALSVIQAEYGCVDSVQALGEQGEINLEEFNRLMESWLKNSPRIKLSTEEKPDQKQGLASNEELMDFIFKIRCRLIRIEDALSRAGISPGMAYDRKFKGGGAPEPSCSIPCPPRK